MEYNELIKKAFEARENSYSPYSGFMVGAALLTKDGKIYTGCNIENAAFGDTMCAERTALFKSVSEGEREFSAICIVGGKKEDKTFDFCFPCGSCRQALSEFAGKDFVFVFSKTKEPKDESDVLVLKFNEVLPYSFEKEML